MKELASRIGSAIALITLLTAHTASAAYVIEASDEAGRLGEGHFTYTGTGGTAASYSPASAGQLPATTDPTPTFFSLRHAWGGDTLAPNLDQYTFTYSPLSDVDNTAFAAGVLFNSLGAAPDLVSSGLTGGGVGIYNVYRIHPGNPGVSGGNTTYQVFVNGGLELAQSIDQNAANLTTGENVGRWELLGSIDLLNNTDTVTVTMTPETTGYTSMRASGIMFEYVAIPEPSVVALLGVSSLLLWVRRRLMI